jgi:hypothetical protein
VPAAHSGTFFFQLFWPPIQVCYLFSQFQFLVSGFWIRSMRQNGLVCLVCKGQRDCPKGAAGAGSPFRALFFQLFWPPIQVCYLFSYFYFLVFGFWIPKMRLYGLVCLVCKGQRDCPRGAAGAGSPLRALFFQLFWPPIQVCYLFSYFHFLVFGFLISKMRLYGFV